MQVLVKKMFRVYNMAMEFAVSSRGHRRRHVLCRGAACGCLAEAALNAPGWLWRRDQGSGQLAAQAAKWIQGQCRLYVHLDGGLHGTQEAILTGIVDESHYILCLLESESPEDHQIAAEMILGDERFHIAALPTYHLDLLIYDLEEGVKEQLLSRHIDRLVIAFGLLNTSPTTRLVVIKNLRVCVD
ncbi:hypothetical protein ZWY2020_002428 [Hordeum vulgare]|nr:hypothetical protein ZWY2020_002428 [Hordeum vulgare]